MAITGVPVQQLELKCKGGKKNGKWKLRNGGPLPGANGRSRRDLRFLFDGDISDIDADLLDVVEDSVEDQILAAGDLADDDLHGVVIDPEAGHVDVLLSDKVDESKLKHTAVLVSADGQAKLSSDVKHLDN